MLTFGRDSICGVRLAAILRSGRRLALPGHCFFVTAPPGRGVVRRHFFNQYFPEYALLSRLFYGTCFPLSGPGAANRPCPYERKPASSRTVFETVSRALPGYLPSCPLVGQGNQFLIVCCRNAGRGTRPAGVFGTSKRRALHGGKLISVLGSAPD